MDEKENVTEQLQKLISEYDFNVDTLSNNSVFFILVP